MDLLFVDTNGVGLPGGMTHRAAIAKYGAGQVDLLFLDSLYKVLEIIPIPACLVQQISNFIAWSALLFCLWVHLGYVSQVIEGGSFSIPLY